jgi:polysaccharide chain length determinant protein (PEP-CTERM system associated)
MATQGVSGAGTRKPTPDSGVSLEHYVQLIFHRKWIILAIFILVTVVTVVVVQALPNVYTAQTVILVDPQKVPESYVKSTVTGSVRDRLSTLSQQILSTTRLQKIIDSLHLYQAERKKLAREEIIALMRKEIKTTVVSDFGASQELQAFRITYNGADPRLVAQVTNQLAELFIEENLKAREQQSTGTTEFLENQLQDSRKTLEDQEARLRDFRMKHIGEMPEQQNATIQILGQLQNQVQVEGDALNRAEQQKALIQSMAVQNPPVVDLDATVDDMEHPAAPKVAGAPAAAGAPKKSNLELDRAKLAELLTRYKDTYPDVVKLKKQIQQEEAKEAVVAAATESPKSKVLLPPPPPAPSATASVAPAPAAPPIKHFNPVLQAQIQTIDAEIAKHKQELERLSKAVAKYQAKLEAIPIREQETLALSRNYEMTKSHYAQLEAQVLSAQTATQLEMRQQGERFVVLDPAVPPEKPSKPNRPLLDAAGSLVGLLLGLGIAMFPEFIGMTIIGPQDVSATNLTLLETIPVIMTQSDQIIRKRWMMVATASAVLVTLTAGALLFLRLRNMI